MRYLLILALASVVFAQRPVSFNRDIRPIMADTCFRCHGPDAGTRMANLRLDLRDEATKANRAGRTPIVPGKPEESQIVARVFHTNPARVMPPPSAHKELGEKQKETIRRWVAEGARYEGHWAYEPIRKQAGASVDSLVEARLKEEGLSLSAEADKRTLLRRVTLDLTGLPPTAAEVNAFLADTSASAYEKTVDRLLSSQAHAEKMTMHWLDAVRYADTSGFHGDNLYPSWPYRDYVLKSFLDNKRFDVFTREQLAGDLLPNATTEQKIAAAFNRLNRTSAEGGLQPKEYLAKYGADRVRTVSAVWLGATLGCAECHDHKFDPLTSRDFYSMKAFFADIKETGLVPDRGARAWGSVMRLGTEAQQGQLAQIDARIAALRQQIENQQAAAPELLKAYEAGELAWKVQRPLTAASRNGAALKIYNEEEVDSMPYVGGIIRSFRGPGKGLIVASGPNPDNETYTITIRPAAGRYTALGLEVVQDEGNPGNGVARGADRLAVTEVEAYLGRKRLDFSLATSNVADPTWEQPAMSAIDGDSATAWGVVTYGENKNPFLALRLRQPLVLTGQETLRVEIRHDSVYRKATIGRMRLAMSTGTYGWPEGTDITEQRNKDGKNPGGLPVEVVKALRGEKDADAKALARYLAWMRGETMELARHEQQRYYLEAAIPKVLLTERVEPETVRILPRGNFLDETGAVVEPAIPARFGKLNTAGRATRLDLANWIVAQDNPLTPRVQVNRMWRMLFGVGLSKVLDDIGSQGELPVNPDLLDYLAAEFQSDWDLRRLVKQIVMSRTYRQSSQATKQAAEKDPDNRLLSHQSRTRVDAEVVHDIALSAAGLLKPRFGGPSVRPYQPEGYLGALNFPKRDYSASRGAELYARGLYTQWQRTFLHPSLMTFDAPSREECTVNRVNSNTPLQALVLLNDPIYVEAARVFAQKMLAEGGKTIEEQIDWAYLRTVARPATAEEKAILKELHGKNLARFRADAKAARQLLTVGDAPLTVKAKPEELAAAATVTRAILNLHEAITRN
ncbi:MAG: PSD1 and planctomycete cytochrome C domain-containing protein [Acidobacteriota bacterium]